jgi:two-component system chemotaxis sensor kinase CheA
LLETVFGVELAERVRTLNALLLRLEQGGEDVQVTLARELHSLKSAARVVGNLAVEQVAHAAESAALEEHGRPSAAAHDALFDAIDALQGLHDGARHDSAQIVEALDGHTPPRAPTPISARKPTESVAPLVTDKARPRSEQTGSVRVAVGKLDTLLSESGELSVAHLRVAERLGQLRALQSGLVHWQRDWRKSRPVRARLRRAEHDASGRDVETLLRLVEKADEELQRIVHDTSGLVSALAATTAQLGSVAGAISQEVMAIRLLPAGTVFQPLERLVRDVSRQTGKEATLILEGIDTEIDRRILDEVRDPLMHMVRNTIDHGIEMPAERLAAGKPAQGTLRLSAAQRGDRVQITVADDGRGLDVDAIRETAVRRGLLTAERAENLDMSSAIDLIFHPGFSTRTTVSELSGRGVGMDVVRAHVERLGGEISVRSTQGTGTSFTITVPLTLATTRVLLVEDHGEMYAVPSSTIERTGRVRSADLLRLEGRRAIQIEGRAVPVVELADVLQRPRSDEVMSPQEWRPYFVLPHGDRAVALLTTYLVDEQELVIKALGAPLKRVKHIGGAAVLGTGAVVVILNPGDLTKTALGNLDNGLFMARNVELPAVAADAPRRRVLVVDDSVMTRTLERSILEAAGYEVVIAIDGQQALEILATITVDAIVSDVEMPRLNGFDLTSAIRRSDQLRHLPVVLVTSLDAPEQVERGAAAGADAYIVKGRFDQHDLLQTLERLL